MSISPSPATISRQIVLASRPNGVPTSSNFTMTTAELSAIEDDEFLVKNRWMSVDPYMRGRMNEGDSYVPAFKIGEPLEGGCVGEVVESQNDKFDEGDIVLGNLGWREYWKSTGQGVTVIDMQGFIVRDHMQVQNEFIEEMASLVKANKVVWEETTTEGLDYAPDALIGLFDGDNLGKQLFWIS